jgi:hypothetical protein
MREFTFRELNAKDFIERCGAILPNKMQCYKPSVFVVLSDSDAKEGTFKPYQVCKMHRVVMSSLGTTVGPIKGIEGTGTVQGQDIPQKELEPRVEEKKENKSDKEEKTNK